MDSKNPIKLVQAMKETNKSVAERNIQMKFKATKEEKEKITQNANMQGYASVASFIRSQCLNTNNDTLSIRRKCEIREELQTIVKLSDNNSKIIHHTDKISNIINKAGE